jgi:hypothetical protein
MKTIGFKLEVEFLTPILGSQPSNKTLASEFIAKRKGLESLPENEDELLPEAVEKGTTVFYRVPGREEDCALLNYQVLGFLKASAQVQNGRVDGNVKALKSKVENNVFVSPRVIPLVLPQGGEMDYLERPLRAETMQGPRVTLARSEMLPEGTKFSCGVEILEKGPIVEEVLRDLLDYGYYRGIGQWHNSGSYGTFRYTLTRED